MGLNITSSANLRDYINENFSAPGNRMADFNTMVEFGGELGYKVGKDLQIAVEGSYAFNSFTNITANGKYELSYSFVAPTLLAYYMIEGNGYSFKFGGGAGPRFVTLDEIKPLIVTGLTYTSTGFGIVARVSGSTALSKNIFAYIGGDARYDAGGVPKNEGNPIHTRDGDLSVSSLSLGLKLGVSFTF
ncbi:MAG: hypothetical protein IFNCLDLE_00099 [Ignavibacteriaceae bacterium]|nr:hypothetical protein [Ignavibacteriaceae bacterium]